MGDLFSALHSAAQSLQAFQRAVDVTQNNVVNANSPGYAKQVAQFQAQEFDPNGGLSGGVVEYTQDTRNPFAESAVQQQLGLLGQYQQLQTSLAPLQTIFDVSGNSPIPSALNQLFQSFSAWSSQPGDATQQTNVITAAKQVATAFQQTAAQLTNLRATTDSNLQSVVAQINQDAAQIRDYNVNVTRLGSTNPGLSAQLENTLEDLSSLAGVQVINGLNGTVTVLLGGQTPLVIGTDLNELHVGSDTANATAGPANATIVDQDGNDVTSRVTAGSLSGLLTIRNSVIPSLIGGGQQTGDVNTLAKGLADTVNDVLAQGSTTSAPPYQTGSPLFTYDPSSPSGIARSLSVDPTVTAGQLAATDPGPPPVLNGIALKLAGLDSDPAGQINGLNFTQYFGTLVSRVGNAASQADSNVTVQTQLVTQAKSLRQQLSGVSIDEEAVRLIELQRSFQATSKVVSVIDELTQTLLNLVQ